MRRQAIASDANPRKLNQRKFKVATRRQVSSPALVTRATNGTFTVPCIQYLHGIISQNTVGYSFHDSSAADYSDLIETTETNNGFQPQFLMGGVMAVMTITPVTGWNPSTATRFI